MKNNTPSEELQLAPQDSGTLAHRMAIRDALEKELLAKREARSRQYESDLANDCATEAHQFPAQVSIHDN